jgi:hypothetical protein
METKLWGRAVDDFWLWISMSHATYAIHVKDGKIEDAPPIARWSLGYPAQEIIEKLLEVKGAIIIRMKDDVKEKEN